MFCLFGGLVMLQPDMGTTIILAILAGTILFVGGVRMRHMATVLGAGARPARRWPSSSPTGGPG